MEGSPLIIAPRLGDRARRPIFAAGLAAAGVICVIWLFGQMSWMGYQVPLQGCSACHRAAIVGDAPPKLSDFEIRDPDWVIFPLQDPLGSLLEPYPTPQPIP